MVRLRKTGVDGGYRKPPPVSLILRFTLIYIHRYNIC